MDPLYTLVGEETFDIREFRLRRFIPGVKTTIATNSTERSELRIRQSRETWRRND